MRKIALVACLVFILAIVLTVVVSSASEKASPASVVPSPSNGSAVVDGNYNDWNLTNDFISNMYRAWKDNKTVESKVYLKYECTTGTLYALVLCVDGVTINPIADENWIKESGIKLVDGTSDNNGTPPDFQYIYQGEEVIGWEASVNMELGDYTEFAVHAEVIDAGKSQTSGTPNKEISLHIECGTPDE